MTDETLSGNQGAGAKLAPAPVRHPARVWLVDDQQIFRESYAKALESAHEFKCDRQFNSAEELLAALQMTSGPDVVLLESGLPGMSGIAAVKVIKSCSPATVVFLLSAYTSYRQMAEALDGGASGYFRKNDPPEAVVVAMRVALRGREAQSDGARRPNVI